MKKFLWNIAKAAAVMFAVGAVLAIAAPHIAVAIGLAETTAAAIEVIGASTANPLWLGSFFGAFGAASTALTPAVNYAADKIASLFSKKSKPEPEAAFNAGSLAIETPELAPDEAITRYRDMVAAPSQNTQGMAR